MVSSRGGVRASLATAVVAGVLAVACSGGGDSAEAPSDASTVAASTAVTSSSEPVAATAPPVSDSTSPPTTGVPITEAPTTEAPTTEAPTTTALDDPARMRAAEEGYLAAWEAYHQAILDPANPTLRAEVERTYTGPNLDGVIQTLDRYVADTVIAQENPRIPARAEILQPGLPVPGESKIVDIVVCEVNSEWYFEVGTRPDGGDSLIRDEVVALRILVRVEDVDGSWKLRSGENLNRETGVDTCSE